MQVGDRSQFQLVLILQFLFAKSGILDQLQPILQGSTARRILYLYRPGSIQTPVGSNCIVPISKSSNTR